MITRPVRERPADQVRTMVSDGLRRTGYDEVALTSLSTADFSGIDEVIDDLSGRNELCGPGGLVSVNLPSLRVDAFTVGIAAKLQRARRSGLTFAPEAGTWRMRQVINKLITEEDLYTSVEAAYSQGWKRVKLYFLTGLPTETDEDTLGIAELGRNVARIGRSHNKGASVTVSVGGFVPKVHTPFQWFGQNTEVELRRKIGLLRDDLRSGKGRDKANAGVNMKWHDPRASVAEGLASRGDRRIGAGHRDGVAQRRRVPGVGRALPGRPLDRGHGGPRPRHGLVRPPAPHRGRGAALGPPLGRAAPRLPVAGLARRPRRAGPARLPVDPLLRLRRLHRATRSSTWSRRPRRRPAGARAPVRTWPGATRSRSRCCLAAPDLVPL